jgi:hypothetical protein
MVAKMRSRAMRLLSGVCLLMLTFVSGVHACTICFSWVVITPGQKLDSADQAVLAIQSVDPSGFRIVAVVKGDVAADEAIAESALLAPPGEPQWPDGKPLLLVRNHLSADWTSIGAIGVEYAVWLRQLAASNHGGGASPARIWPQPLTGSYLTEAEWLERVRLVAPYLEDTEPLAAEIAFGEIARAPHSARRSLKPQLDAARIAGWIDNPKLASRRAAYTMLLGVAGGQEDAIEIERRIGKALLARDATNLSAMLAADLELRGPSRLDWLKATYFADRRRTLPEIDAALLALSVHGEADASIPRERVIETYRYFIKVRQPMAGFVAMELASWEAWDATADYVEIIRSKAVKDPASQFAILSYLKSSPLTAGQAALLPAAE